MARPVFRGLTWSSQRRDKLFAPATKEGFMSVTAIERAKLGYGLGKEEGEAFWLLACS
jgi:hypothetical protein